MSEKYPKDSFDNLSQQVERRGVHRAPRKKGAGLISFAWAALATGILVTIGVAGLVVVSDSVSLRDFEEIFAVAESTPSATPRPTAAPTVDPSLLVNVLNATGTTGIATEVGDKLAADGWTVSAKSNASETVDKTVVYYGNPSLEGAARGVAESLGVGEIDLTDAYIESSAQITVVVGSDYVDPVGATPTPTQ